MTLHVRTLHPNAPVRTWWCPAAWSDSHAVPLRDSSQYNANGCHRLQHHRAGTIPRLMQVCAVCHQRRQLRVRYHSLLQGSSNHGGLDGGNACSPAARIVISECPHVSDGNVSTAGASAHALWYAASHQLLCSGRQRTYNDAQSSIVLSRVIHRVIVRADQQRRRIRVRTCSNSETW